MVLVTALNNTSTVELLLSGHLKFEVKLGVAAKEGILDNNYLFLLQAVNRNLLNLYYDHQTY